MSVARFPVVARLDNAGGNVQGTVLIDRETNMFSVRRHKSHRVYTVPLGMVATMVVERIILNELNDKKKAKKAARRAR